MKISISGFDNTLFIPSDGGIATLVICNDLTHILREKRTIAPLFTIATTTL